ncbi:MAG TPA: hypothetical protein VI455_16310, partial [Terriglobia bacterium]
MQTLDYADKTAADLYWLAFLLTEGRGPSLDLTLEALASPGDGNSFFSSWILAWSRRVFIAKALATVRGELAQSARRTASRRADKVELPPRNWSLDRNTTKSKLQDALLAIDLFPRCALLLSVFEGAPLED